MPMKAHKRILYILYKRPLLQVEKLSHSSSSFKMGCVKNRLKM